MIVLNPCHQEDGFGYAIHNDPAEEPFCDFILPDEDYRDMTFARRLEAEGTSSPPSLPYQLTGGLGRAARRHSTVEDTDGPTLHTFHKFVRWF